MWKELEELKRQTPLLEYLQRHDWKLRRVGSRQEFVGLCPLHAETRPSFYVNAVKNLFFCHGCAQGGDLIRFAQLYFNLPFRQALWHLRQELGLRPRESELLEHTAVFYRRELQRHSEALAYLDRRGVRDPDLMQRLGLGFAPGGNVRRHLTAVGYPLELLLKVGLVDRHGRDTFYRRVIFPCGDANRVVNLYGRSIGTRPAHRFLARPKGGLYAWEAVSIFPSVILVEGLFDLAVLWQAGFVNTTCALGNHLTPAQWRQLCDRPGRQVYLTFDADQAGQRAARALAQRLRNPGVAAHLVALPEGHDPNSFFAAGATADDFSACLKRASALP
jgi:DNA primase